MSNGNALGLPKGTALDTCLAELLGLEGSASPFSSDPNTTSSLLNLMEEQGYQYRLWLVAPASSAGLLRWRCAFCKPPRPLNYRSALDISQDNAPLITIQAAYLALLSDRLA